MRLSKEQMRVIRSNRMKRGDWLGKSLTVWDEHIGIINFGKEQHGLRSIRRRARPSHHASDFRSVGKVRYD
jgi:hypothetical protein